MDSDDLHLIIRDVSDVVCEIDISPSSTVSDLKYVIADSISQPVDGMKLVCKGQIMLDERTLSSYSLQSNHLVYVSFGKKPMKSDNTNNNTNNNQVNQDGFDIAQLLNSPKMKSFMKSIMKSFDENALIDMLMQRPEFADKFKNNPELLHAFRDSSLIEETTSALMNGNGFQQLDRLMNAVEAMPGGFHEMQKQMNDVQNPLMDALKEMFYGKPKNQETKIDETPPEKPSDQPLPFIQESPQQQLPFGLFPGFSFTPPPPQLPQQHPSNSKAVPNNVINIVNLAMDKCKEAGLDLRTIPGFNKLWNACKGGSHHIMSEWYHTYQDYLNQLNEMGFRDNERNVIALLQADGNMQAALDILISENALFF